MLYVSTIYNNYCLVVSIIGRYYNFSYFNSEIVNLLRTYSQRWINTELAITRKKKKEKRQRHREFMKTHMLKLLLKLWMTQALQQVRKGDGKIKNYCLQLGKQASDQCSRQNDDDEDKEVDPSLVGSLDNVYTEETEAAMSKEDPFQNAPVMDKISATSAEMEKTADALVVYASEGEDRNDCTSPLPDEESPRLLVIETETQSESFTFDLLGPNSTSTSSSTSNTTMTASTSTDRGSQELLPDLIGLSTESNSSDMLVNISDNVQPPDITPHGTLPPDLAVDSQHPVDLLNSDCGGLVGSMDLTEGMPRQERDRNNPDIAQCKYIM